MFIAVTSKKSNLTNVSDLSDTTYVDSGIQIVNTKSQKIFKVCGSILSTAAKQAKKHEDFLSYIFVAEDFQTVCRTIESYGTHFYIGTHICQIFYDTLN